MKIALLNNAAEFTLVLMISVSIHGPQSGMDWSFIEAQERFAFDYDQRAAYLSLAESSRELLAKMDSIKWRERDAASSKMFASGDLRACFIGQWTGSPEVRLRCRNILRRLSGCMMCGGSGGLQLSWGWYSCTVCGGTGHFWPHEDLGRLNHD